MNKVTPLEQTSQMTKLFMKDESLKTSCKPSKRRCCPTFTVTDFATDYRGLPLPSNIPKDCFDDVDQESSDEATTKYRTTESGEPDDAEAVVSMAQSVGTLSCSVRLDWESLREEEDTNNPLLIGALQELDESLMDGDHRRTTKAWNSLGLVRLHTQRNPREALRCHENALHLLESSLSSLEECSSRLVENEESDETPSSLLVELATTYHDLGLCYERLNDTKQAMESYHKAKDELSKEMELMDTYPQTRTLNRSIERLQRAL
jgi:tetratricopeptide (TPR) repeat protein